jgi:hypothetical protein
MRNPDLFPLVREKLRALLGTYFDPPEIVPPQLGARAGVLGAIALAEQLK